MNLLNNYHKVTPRNVSEYDMQKQVDSFLKEYEFRKWDGWNYQNLPKIVLREFSVPEVCRISDHVLLIAGKRVINLECKLQDIGCVIKQAKDHLNWCDYSIIIIPPDYNYVANSYKLECIQHGIGLWYWFNEVGVYEFILPAFNKNSNKIVREQVIKRIVRTDELIKQRNVE